MSFSNRKEALDFIKEDCKGYEKGYEYFLNGFTDDDKWNNLSDNNLIKIAETLTQFEESARVDEVMWMSVNLGVD
tara:strand:+ start:253 stop:477 length:225 start_codon:yes stop_codon:yes gene_type:complete